MGRILQKILIFLGMILITGLSSCRDKSYPCPSYADSPSQVDTSKGKSFIRGFRQNTNPETGLLDKGKNKKLDKELKNIRKRKRKRLKRGR